MVQTKNVKIIALLMIYLVLPIHFSQLVYASSFSVQMPEYANSNTFSFNGTTSPNTIVRVYVNGNEFSSTLSDSNGFFRFGRVLLNRNSQNTVRLHGTDTQSGTTFSQDFTVISEDNPPEFLDVQEPPAIVGERFVQIAGTLSKNAHVVAIVNDRSVDIAADSSVFNAQVPLEEGENTIVLRATDRAGNTRQRQFTVVADTVPPRIVSTNIADISPTYTNQVTIRGEVSKPVRVAIVLNNDNRYACLEQAPVSPDCLALLEDDGSSRNLFVTETDSDGTFSKQINLGFGFDSSYTEASTVQVGADTSRIELRFQSTDATNHVRVIAIDRAGQVDSTSGDVTYSSCSSGEGDFLMFQGQVFPAMIIPDHVFQGIAQVSFEVELNYLDQRHTPEDIQLRVGTRELSVEDRESWSINLFDPARCIATPDDSGLNWYVNCALRRYPAAAYRNITEAYEYFEDKGFVKLPINLEITYTAPGTFADMRYGGEGGIDGRNLDLRETQITKTQIVCYDMEIALDRRVPPDKIPRSLLENTVEVLDTVIDAIDQILPYVQRAKLITFATCLILNVYEIFQNLGETAACGPGGFLNELTGMGVTRDEGLSIDRYINGQPPGSGFDLSEEDIRAIAHAHNPNADNLDEHINRIQTCASVKSRVKRADVKRQWVCDRIFCPMVPSFQKYFQDAPESSACYAYRTGDISVLPQSRTGGPNSYVTLEGGEPTLCEYDYLNEWNSACLGLNPLQESRELQYQDDSAPVSRALNLINGLSLCEFGDQGANDNRVAYASGTHSIIQDTNQGSPRYQ
ncbi:MAG: hypothetical protein ACMXYK_04020, partial [Candidatus Woesearchaeota archaeon]